MKKGFLFSGNNDIGDVIKLGDSYQVDFLGEDETCYGLAFRRNVDITFEDNIREVTIEFQTSKKLKASLEFKTENSGNAPEEAFKICATEGVNSFNFLIPKLSSKIKEICFCIFKKNNTDLETEVSVLDFYVN